MPFRIMGTINGSFTANDFAVLLTIPFTQPWGANGPMSADISIQNAMSADVTVINAMTADISVQDET